MKKQKYHEKLETPIIGEKGVIICGGGPAGIAAAVAAAEEGADVILIERYGYLTGAHASATIGTFCGVYNIVQDEINQLVKGIMTELLNQLKRVDGLCEPIRFGKTAIAVYDPLWFKQISENLVLRSGANLLMHALVVDVIMDGNTVKGVIIESKSGRQAIMGATVIDATGDADIAARAGVPYRMGDNGFMQFPSTMFRMASVNKEKAKQTTYPELTEKIREARNSGRLILPRDDALFFFTPRKGEVVCNVTTVSRQGKVINGTDVEDLTFAEIEGKKQAREYEAFFRKYVPGFEEAYIEDTGQIGIRETRIIDGEYILKNEDVVEGKKFNDAIARSAWPIELHALDEMKWVWLEEGDYYEIPYRCLVPQKVENLLVAGRCISSEHEAQASVRVAGQCFAEGEAAGTAAAMALEKGVSPRKIDSEALRKRLIDRGADL